MSKNLKVYRLSDGHLLLYAHIDGGKRQTETDRDLNTLSAMEISQIIAAGHFTAVLDEKKKVFVFDARSPRIEEKK
jgi:hypothetical protein